MHKSTHEVLLFLHSLMRWLVLLGLCASVVRAFIGWRKQLAFTRTDDRLRGLTTTIVQLQLLVGIVLYTISPLIKTFWQQFGEAVHVRQLRFFGMEHSLVMVIAVMVLTVGSARVQQVPMQDSQRKFKLMALWFLAALLLIISAVPWWFSPLTSRPMFRVW